jgi:hypothetical protein
MLLLQQLIMTTECYSDIDSTALLSISNDHVYNLEYLRRGRYSYLNWLQSNTRATSFTVMASCYIIPYYKVI